MQSEGSLPCLAQSAARPHPKPHDSNPQPQDLKFFVPLWLYSPILGLGPIHETLRFISVTTSRTVGRTTWTGDQLVARPLLTAQEWLWWWWRSWWNERFWQRKPKHSEKTCPGITLSTKNPTCPTRARTRASAVGSQLLTASAIARPSKSKVTYS
jgi:hypothetical protein